jgi:hypothetical protein
MALHLEEISLAVAPGAHAILLLDQAGWHVSKRLSIPTSSTIAASPGISSSKCPGKSCPSGPETGSTGHDHQDLV